MIGEGDRWCGGSWRPFSPGRPRRAFRPARLCARSGIFVSRPRRASHESPFPPGLGPTHRLRTCRKRGSGKSVLSRIGTGRRLQNRSPIHDREDFAFATRKLSGGRGAGATVSVVRAGVHGGVFDSDFPEPFGGPGMADFAGISPIGSGFVRHRALALASRLGDSVFCCLCVRRGVRRRQVGERPAILFWAAFFAAVCARAWTRLRRSR